MDVQTLDPAAAQAASGVAPGSVPAPNVGTGAPTPAPPGQQDAQSGADAAHAAGSGKLPDHVAKIFAGGSANITVSFRVEHSPNEIVTVFKDSGGNVIAQVPSEIMVKIAEFFDQLSGVFMDKVA